MINIEKEDEIRKKLLDVTKSNKFNKYMGFEMLELNNDYAKSRIKFREEVLNPYGSIHGGGLLTMADTTAGTAACMCGYYASTVSCNLNFLMPAKNTEYIYCECKKLKGGKHIAVFDVKITDDADNLLDSGEFSFFISKVSITNN